MKYGTRLLSTVLAALLFARAAQTQPIPNPPAPPAETTPRVLVPGPLGAPPPTALPPAPQPAAPPPAAAPPPPPAGAATAAPAAGAWPLQAPATRRPGYYRERMRLLDATMLPMAERSHDARLLEGIISLVLGAGVVTLGFVLRQPSSSDTGAVNISTWFFIYGGYSIASGALELAWVPARERLSNAYTALPRRTPHERREAVMFGEQALDDVAADGARRRVLSSLTGTAFSVGMLGLLYYPQIFDGQPWPTPPAYNYLIIGLTGLGVVTGLLGIFGRSEEERRRDLYRREVDTLRQEAAETATSP